MKINKTYHLLSRFSKLEQKKLIKFLIYMYEEDHPKITFVRWFFSKDRNGIELTNKVMFDMYGPEYRVGNFSNMITQLGADIDKYLVTEQTLKDDIFIESSLIKIYAARGDSYLLSKLMDRLETKSENGDISLETELYLMMAYHHNYYSGVIEDRKLQNKIFEEMIFNFRMFSSKMAQLYHSEIINRVLLRKNHFADEEKYFSQFLDTPTNIQEITHLSDEMLSKMDDGSYQELYALIKTSEHWSHTLRYVIFSYMTTYLNNALKTKDKSRLPELLALYKFGAENGLLSSSKNIPFVVFSNIIGAAGKAEEHVWASKFISDYVDKVDVGDQRALEQYANAKLNFQLKKFDACIKALARFRHESKYVEYFASWIYFCATYEENSKEVELIKARIKALNRFLTENKTQLSHSSMEGSLNTLKAISLSLNPNNKERVQRFLDSKSQFVNSMWLIDVLKRKKVI